jgi:UDPglucose 6-dehydrogenase
MNICVVGTGYVGLVTGICLADLGNSVICVDVDAEKIKNLSKGIPTIFETGIRDILERTIASKQISFTTEIKSAIEKSEVIFIAVGTPEKNDFEPDLSYVFAVAKDIGRYMDGYKVIVDKSTVPVGTAEQVKNIIKSNQKKHFEFDVVSNPEFQREGTAIQDFTVPDRVVIGIESERAKKVMESIYKGITRTGKPMLFTDVKTAEMIKYASNAMLATRISFMNQLTSFCEKVGADIKQVAKGMGLDERIGPRFLQAGIGYGGSCFPKDVKALIWMLEQQGCTAEILRAVIDVNEAQKRIIIPKLTKHLSNLKGKQIGIWGLSFKPKTDDMREAPSLVIINELQKLGAKIKAFDPESIHNAKKYLHNVIYCTNPYDAAEDCDAVILVTEWNIFRDLDLQKVKGLMKKPILIDGRNIYEPDDMKKLGFIYECIGRYT